MMKPKIELPKERIPLNTRPVQVHKDVNDYNRNLEKEEVHKAIEESSESE